MFVAAPKLAVVNVVVSKDGAKLLPNNIVLSELTLSIGRPEILLTANNSPIKLSVILNNSPAEPWTLNSGEVEPEPNICTTPVLVPLNTELPLTVRPDIISIEAE